MSRLPSKIYLGTLLLVLIVWTFSMTATESWYLFKDFWPASVTMLFGSFVAGSTPAGGGAVAFPVFTKLLGVASDTARTHALMIQAIGMSMASLYILTNGIPIYRRVVKWACLGGALGMTGGTFFLTLPEPYPKVIFTSVVLAFGVTFAITHRVLRLQTSPELPDDWGSRHRSYFVLAGLIGGIISSVAGSGTDLVCFIVMTLGYGLVERRSIATSVIIMAVISVLGFFLHGLILGDTKQAEPYWLVSIPVVAMGAPLGALVVSRLPEKILVSGILLLVVVETVTTLGLVMVGASNAVWLTSGITLAVAAVWFAWMVRKRCLLVASDHGKVPGGNTRPD